MKIGKRKSSDYNEIFYDLFLDVDKCVLSYV